LRGITDQASGNYYGYVQRVYAQGYAATILRLQDAGLSMHEVAAELNTHSGRAMNGAAWDAGRVLGVLRLNEAIHRNDAILREERAIRMTGVS
jgi:hypothetical protein